MALIDFTLSNARRFYSSMGNPFGLKGLKQISFSSEQHVLLSSVTLTWSGICSNRVMTRNGLSTSYKKTEKQCYWQLKLSLLFGSLKCYPYGPH